MPSKKRKGGGKNYYSKGSYTGGTGDIKPQWLTATSSVIGAVNDYSVAVIDLPVPRFGPSSKTATVTEILRVDWYLNIADAFKDSGGVFGCLDTSTSKVSGEASSLIDNVSQIAKPSTFACASLTYLAGGTVAEYPVSIDMTDGNGNGILIAADRLDMVVGYNSNTAFGLSVCKVLYRMVNIGVEEYVGILQAQAGGS